MKNKVVVVGEVGAKVFHNPSDIEGLKKYGEVLIDPDMSFVKGISPSFWKLTKDGLREMSDEEKKYVHDQNPSHPSIIGSFSPRNKFKEIEEQIDMIWDYQDEVGKELNKITDFRLAFNRFKNATINDILDLREWEAKLQKQIWVSWIWLFILSLWVILK